MDIFSPSASYAGPLRAKEPETLSELIEPSHDALSYLRCVGRSMDLDTCWRQLCADLAGFGFSQVIYARKPGATVTNFHQLWDTLILSTYGAAAEDFLVGARGYTAETTVKWAVEHEARSIGGRLASGSWREVCQSRKNRYT